jgi:hypothetical protein
MRNGLHVPDSARRDTSETIVRYGKAPRNTELPLPQAVCFPVAALGMPRVLLILPPPLGHAVKLHAVDGNLDLGRTPPKVAKC